LQTEKTTLECDYTPRDFFEAPYQVVDEAFSLKINDGRALIVLTTAQESVPADLIDIIRQRLEVVFSSRSLIEHRQFSLSDPTILQKRPGGETSVNHILSGKSAMVAVAGMRADFVITDAAGNIKSDSRAERIAREAELTDCFSTAAMKDELMQALMKSYQAAIAEPANELVRLYEIADALQKQYHGEKNAYPALGPGTKCRWKRLKEIANALPLNEGRHVGKHTGQLRPATKQELAEARACARSLIEAYARTVVPGPVDHQDLSQDNQGDSQ